MKVTKKCISTTSHMLQYCAQRLTRITFSVVATTKNTRQFKITTFLKTEEYSDIIAQRETWREEINRRETKAMVESMIENAEVEAKQ